MKFSFLVVFFCLLFIISCSDNDDGLVGSWVLSSVELSSCADTSLNQQISATTSCVTIESDQRCISLIFNADGTGTLDNNGSPLEFVYEQMEGSNDLELCNQDDLTECSTFLFDGSKLSLEDFEEGCDVNYFFAKN